MYVIAIISVLLGAIGQILVKMGARPLEFSLTSSNLLQSLLAIIKSPLVMSGLFFYGLSFLLWVKVLSKLELSYAYPLVSLGYILIMLVSYFVFQENITAIRVVGCLFILIGVVLVSQS